MNGGSESNLCRRFAVRKPDSCKGFNNHPSAQFRIVVRNYIMSSEEDVDDTLRTITDFICDLLVKYQDSPNVDEWLFFLMRQISVLWNITGRIS